MGRPAIPFLSLCPREGSVSVSSCAKALRFAPSVPLEELILRHALGEDVTGARLADGAKIDVRQSVRLAAFEAGTTREVSSALGEPAAFRPCLKARKAQVVMAATATRKAAITARSFNHVGPHYPRICGCRHLL